MIRKSPTNINTSRICSQCSLRKTIKTWYNKTCPSCYFKKLNKIKKAFCIVCKGKKTQGIWYKGPTCSMCYRKKTYPKWRKKYLKKTKAINRTLKSRYNRGKYKAKKENIIWDITFNQYEKIINKGCFYCKKSLLNYAGVSLDRKNPRKDYKFKNVLPCCKNCNWIKNEHLTVIETLAVIEFIGKLRNTNKIWKD